MKNDPLQYELDFIFMALIILNWIENLICLKDKHTGMQFLSSKFIFHVSQFLKNVVKKFRNVIQIRQIH